MTRDEIMALTGRELDAAVWSAFEPDGYDSSSFPGYSENPFAVQDMEAEIERRGLVSEYLDELSDMTDDGDSSINAGIWRCMTAPLETKCKAALLSVLTD